MITWFLLGLAFAVAVWQTIINFWAKVTKERIVMLFEKDEERWWLLYALRTNTRAPSGVVDRALELIRKERELQVRVILVKGMQESVGEFFVPVLLLAYRLGNGPKRREKEIIKGIKRKLIPRNVFTSKRPMVALFY